MSGQGSTFLMYYFRDASLIIKPIFIFLFFELISVSLWINAIFFERFSFLTKFNFQMDEREKRHLVLRLKLKFIVHSLYRTNTKVWKYWTEVPDKKNPMLTKNIHFISYTGTATDNIKQSTKTRNKRKRKFRSHNLQILILS